MKKTIKLNKEEIDNIILNSLDLKKENVYIYRAVLGSYIEISYEEKKNGD